MLQEKAFGSDFSLVNKATFLSEYYSRGVTQTQGLPASQFETTLSHNSGFFAGVFASRVEFLDNDQADLELDYYFGYNQTCNNWYYRVAGIYFTYPNAEKKLNYDFFELDLGLGYNYKPFYTELSLRVSPNHFASSGIERYAKAQLSIPVLDNLKLKSHIAHRYVEETETFYNIADSFDWEFGFEYTPIKNTDLIFQFVDSSLKQSECLNRDFCDERFIAGIRYSF